MAPLPPGRELTRKRIRLTILGARSVRQGEIKATKKKVPSGLPWSSAIWSFECTPGSGDQSRPGAAPVTPPTSGTTPPVPSARPATHGYRCHSSALWVTTGEKSKHKSVTCYHEGTVGRELLRHLLLTHRPPQETVEKDLE